MKTLIELFDERPIENVLATEMFRPEKTVFICPPEIARNIMLRDRLKLYFRKRGEDRRFRLVWLYILLSFLFYIPVAVAAGLLPILGMLMLPKTVCYILLILVFLRYTRQEIPAA